MGLFSLGVKAVELSAIAADGDVGTAFAPLGLTKEGTVKFNFADPTITELKVEEFTTAADSDIADGDKTIQFTIANPDEDTFVSVFGGTKSGTGATTKFTAPLTAITIEKSLRVTLNKGLIFIFPRVLVTAKPTSDIGRGNWLGVDVTCKVLQPTKSGVSAFSTARV